MSYVKLIDCTEIYNDLVSFASNRYYPVHRWYNLVEGYSRELVRRIIGELNELPNTCLDPFAGVGTTALTCQELGIKCVSIENNPFFYDVAKAKLRADYSAKEFHELIIDFETYFKNCKFNHLFPKLESETFFEKEGLKKWIFDKPVALAIFDILNKIKELEIHSSIYTNLFKIAIASILTSISNVFRNGKCLAYKKDWYEIRLKRKEVHEQFIKVCTDILLIDIRTQEINKPLVHNFVNFFHGDSRELVKQIPNNSIDLIITSPPYLNSRDYTDTYRLELWILGYITNFKEEQTIRKSALTSHVQITLNDFEFPQIKELKEFIHYLESLDGQLWNKNIPKMVKGYFSDMHDILFDLKDKLKDGSKLYINISNSAYAGKICEVDYILIEIAKQLGYKPIQIRKARFIKSSRQQKLPEKLRESIIVLQK